MPPSASSKRPVLADCERADGLPADHDRDDQIRQHADAATVFPFLHCLAGEIVGQAGQTEGLTADKLRVVPGHVRRKAGEAGRERSTRNPSMLLSAFRSS